MTTTTTTHPNPIHIQNRKTTQEMNDKSTFATLFYLLLLCVLSLKQGQIAGFKIQFHQWNASIPADHMRIFSLSRFNVASKGKMLRYIVSVSVDCDRGANPNKKLIVRKKCSSNSEIQLELSNLNTSVVCRHRKHEPKWMEIDGEKRRVFFFILSGKILVVDEQKWILRNSNFWLRRRTHFRSRNSKLKWLGHKKTPEFTTRNKKKFIIFHLFCTDLVLSV